MGGLDRSRRAERYTQPAREQEGISQQLLPRLLLSFEQAPTAIDRSKVGLGMGLALVKSFVELHDGTVPAHSKGPASGSQLVCDCRCRLRD